MPNVASILKAEITRIARKEVRSEVEELKKAIGTYRTEIAALKRRSQSLEQELRRLGKALPRPKAEPPDEAGAALRFSAKGLASQRRRLGLSAEDCGLLLGASGQSVYNWEAGKARPRKSHLAALDALRRLGKRQAVETVAARKGAQ